MDDEAIRHPADIFDDDLSAFSRESARIGDLPTAFGIERRPIEDDLDRITRFDTPDLLAVGDQSDHLTLGRKALVPEKGVASTSKSIS